MPRTHSEVLHCTQHTSCCIFMSCLVYTNPRRIVVTVSRRAQDTLWCSFTSCPRLIVVQFYVMPKTHCGAVLRHAQDSLWCSFTSCPGPEATTRAFPQTEFKTPEVTDRPCFSSNRVQSTNNTTPVVHHPL